VTETPDATLDVVAAAVPAVEETRGAKAKGKRAGGPTEETREFWETWAESKTTREPEAKTEEARPAREERGGRGGREERGGRGGREERGARSSREERAPKRAAAEETTEAVEEAAPADEARTERKSSRGGRDRDRGRGKKDDDKRASKKDDAPAKASSKSAAPAAAAGDQARLFINLGKKHGVSADDLRTLLAGPVGGDTSRIGSVSLRDSHAHVRVPEDLADAIIEGVHGTTHSDETVTVERARA
jgi:hypothetical protein